MMCFYAINMGKYGRYFLTVLKDSGFNLSSELHFSGNISNSWLAIRTLITSCLLLDLRMSRWQPSLDHCPERGSAFGLRDISIVFLAGLDSVSSPTSAIMQFNSQLPKIFITRNELRPRHL